MAVKLLLRSSSLLLLLAMAMWTSFCVLLPASMADHTMQPAASAQPNLPDTGVTTATQPTSSSSSSAAAAAAAAATLASEKPAAAASETTTPATATTAPKEKFPLPTTGGGGGEGYLPTPHDGVQPDLPTTPHGDAGVEPGLPTPHGGSGEPYLPAAEVAGALPVPTPDELPSGASLGFGSNGGLGYGGPGDVCCGGPGGYGWFGGPGGFGPGTYGYSGPLYWGAAPPAAGSFGRVVTNVVVALVVAYASAAIFA